jgi:hypothetical protein
MSNSILQQVADAERKIGPHPPTEFLSTITDLKILAYLALYHSRRMPAAVHYSLFRETQDLWSLEAAIRHEKRAAQAWQKLVESAGDVYASDLKMGIAHGGLAGHWKDELALLREGIVKLERRRSEFQPELRGAEIQIAHAPLRRTPPHNAVAFRATVFSQHKPAHVRCIVKAPSGERQPYDMRPAGRWRYVGEAPLPPAGEQLIYFIEARGSSGGRATYPPTGSQAPICLRVSRDRQPPEIELDRVAAARAGEPVRVSVRATDPSGVKWVRLRYRHLTQFEDYQSVEMVLDEQSGRYAAQIPGKFVVPRWDVMYFVEAMDEEGNGRMAPDLEKEMPYVIVHLERDR